MPGGPTDPTRVYDAIRAPLTKWDNEHLIADVGRGPHEVWLHVDPIAQAWVLTAREGDRIDEPTFLAIRKAGIVGRLLMTTDGQRELASVDGWARLVVPGLLTLL